MVIAGGAHRATCSSAPQILDLPAQRMAAARPIGDPNVVGVDAIAPLYKAASMVKGARKHAGRGPDFTVGPLRARWPNATTAEKEQWQSVWGLTLPEDVVRLPQAAQETGVTLERWEHGTVAEIVHRGPYASEPATIARLLAFIAAQGYRPIGDHEEIYLTRPTARAQKTIIRYRIVPA